MAIETELSAIRAMLADLIEVVGDLTNEVMNLPLHTDTMGIHYRLDVLRANVMTLGQP